MATFSLSDLVVPVTRQQIQTSIYQALGVLGVRTTSWKSGAVPRAIIVAVSVVLAAFSALIADIAAAGFLELTSGKWLTLVARYVYGLERELATFASGLVTLSNSGGGDYTLDPGDLIVRNPTTNRTYRNADVIELGPGETLIDVPILATEVGSASTSGPGDVDELVTTLLGVTVTNPAAIVGRDEESDTSLKTRCSERLGALSPMGPWDAYTSAVRNARRADGSSIGVTRVRTTKDGLGNVTAYCATASGELLGDPEDLDTDLGVANDAIQRWAAPLAVTATADTAIPVPQTIVYEAWMYNTSGRSLAEIQATISAKLVAYIAAQPIGGNKPSSGSSGKLYQDALRAVISGSFPQIFHVVVTSPAADVDLDIDEVPTLAGVTPTSIHQVPPAEGYGA